MIENMRRLHPRGASNRGICVDAQGAMLGPDCVLVRGTPAGFRAIEHDAAVAVQKCAFGINADRDWLFRQCQRIADALDKGEIALAQIYGLRVPVAELDDRQIRRIGDGNLAKAGFDPDEPRLPKGDLHGGEWTTGGNIESDAADFSSLSQLFAVTAGEADGAGSAPFVGAQPAAAGTGDGGESASPLTEPSISFRIIPPRTPAIPSLQTRQPVDPDVPGTLDSPDLQSDPTDGLTTLDSPDLQLPDVSVNADSPENPILTTPGIDAVNPDYTLENFLLLLATRGYSSALRRALAAIGLLRGGDQAHHIVPKWDLRTEAAREVLDRFGIGIDDPINGVGLPPEQHWPLNANAYHEWINQLLRGAGSRSEVEDILRSIARKLQEGRWP